MILYIYTAVGVYVYIQLYHEYMYIRAYTYVYMRRRGIYYTDCMYTCTCILYTFESIYNDFRKYIRYDTTRILIRAGHVGRRGQGGF